MSIFVNESTVIGGKPLVANENYQGEIGAYTILAENVQNDMAMFNSMLAGDFVESKAIHESADASEILVLTENAGMRLIDNIKAFLKKTYEKIKGLIQSFITRMQTVVTRDNKKLVDNHRRAVLTKDLSKFKFSWSAVKDNKDSVYPKVIADTGSVIGRLQERVESSAGIKFDNMSLANMAAVADSSTESMSAEGKAADVASAMGISGSGLEYGSLTKGVMEHLFEDKEEVEGMSDALRNNIMNALSESKEVIKGLKDAEKKIDTQYSKELARLNKLSNEFSKLTAGGKKIGENDVDANEAGKAVRGVNKVYEMVKTLQEINTKTISTTMSVIKIKIKESRAAFSRAAAYRGSVSESAEANNDVVEGDKDTTVEINIEIEDQAEDVELMEAIDDEAENIVEEQFTGGMGY